MNSKHRRSEIHRSCFLVMFLFVGALIGQQASADDKTDKAEVIQAEAKAIEKRAFDSLTSSYPGAKYEAFIVYEAPENSRMTEVKISAYYDQDRMRMKYRFRHLTAAAAQEPNQTKNWLETQYVVIKEEDVIIRNAAYEKGTYKAKQSTMGDLHGNTQTFWPQFIGTAVVPVWRMPQASPRGFLGREDHVAKSITEENLGELKTIRVDYSVQGRGNLSVWYCPAQNGLIVKMYGEGLTNTGFLEAQVEITNQEWSPGIWFPKRIQYRRGFRGNEIEKETTEIKSFEVIEPVDEEFDFGGLDLPIGAPIQDTTVPPAEQLLIWTEEGARLMTEDEIRVKFPTPKQALPKVATNIDEQTGRSYETLIILNLVLIGLFAAWFFWRKRA